MEMQQPRNVLTTLDRVIGWASPKWALNRVRARMALRHFEAASFGRRTDGWSRGNGDPNAVNGPALTVIRGSARDLVRNNPWAKRGLNIVGNNTVGWGIVPRAQVQDDTAIAAAWKAWADSTDCDADGRLNFYGLQRLVVTTAVEAGEVLIRRRVRQSRDGLKIPLQLQVLEPDFLDTTKSGLTGQEGGPIVHGVEHDALGRRVAYWLYPRHPGAVYSMGSPGLASKRVPASEILHVFRVERPGQVRGISWFAPVILRLKDLDDYEDARLMQQKIAACFAAFVTDVDGAGTPLGTVDVQKPLIDTLEPGMVENLPPGKQVSFATPPSAGEHGPFVAAALRGVAAGLGVTYEDLASDYSGLPFSAARMSRLAHWANVHEWRENMLNPQFNAGAWAWFMEAAQLVGELPVSDALPAAAWTPPPAPMIEPDKEGPALKNLVRTGAMSPSEMVRERGGDPKTHWQQYADDLKELDRLGIWLDCDPRRMSQAGLTQERAGSGKTPPAKDGEENPAEE